MITLYRTRDSQLADEAEEALQEMVIAHETVTIGSAEDLPVEGHEVPLLVDDGEAISGEAPLRARLAELRQLMADWDRFQSDGCYIEDDGSAC